MGELLEFEERWLEMAPFEGPYTEAWAVGRLLELRLDPGDLARYGLLFVVPLFGRPDSGCMVVAQHDLHNVYRATAWIWERMGWESGQGRKVMMGRCSVVEGRIKPEQGGLHYPSFAPPDQDLFRWVMEKAGIIIATDPGVRIYNYGVQLGIGAPSSGWPMSTSWDEEMEKENLQSIRSRLEELKIEGVDKKVGGS